MYSSLAIAAPVPPRARYSSPKCPKRGVEIGTFGQAVTWQRWQISGLRLGYPHYMACDLSSEPTLEVTLAVVQNLIFFLKGLQTPILFHQKVWRVIMTSTNSNPFRAASARIFERLISANHPRVINKSLAADTRSPHRPAA